MANSSTPLIPKRLLAALVVLCGLFTFGCGSEQFPVDEAAAVAFSAEIASSLRTEYTGDNCTGNSVIRHLPKESLEKGTQPHPVPLPDLLAVLPLETTHALTDDWAECPGVKKAVITQLVGRNDHQVCLIKNLSNTTFSTILAEAINPEIDGSTEHANFFAALQKCAN